MDAITQGYVDLTQAGNAILADLALIEQGKAPLSGTVDFVLNAWPRNWHAGLKSWVTQAAASTFDTDRESTELAVLHDSIARHIEKAYKVIRGVESPSTGPGQVLVVGGETTTAELAAKEAEGEAGGVSISGGSLLVVAGLVVAGIVAYFMLRGKKQ